MFWIYVEDFNIVWCKCFKYILKRNIFNLNIYIFIFILHFFLYKNWNIKYFKTKSLHKQWNVLLIEVFICLFFYIFSSKTTLKSEDVPKKEYLTMSSLWYHVSSAPQTHLHRQRSICRISVWRRHNVSQEWIHMAT